MAHEKSAGIRYAAFLRGINVGGNKKVPMADLKKMCESLKFTAVKTIIASGNVVFTVDESDPSTLRHSIEKAIVRHFGFEVTVMIRTVDELREMTKRDPFGVKADDITMLYVGFMNKPPAADKAKALHAMNYDIETFDVRGAEVFAIRRMPGERPKKLVIESMEKILGEPVTVRNWNTIQKMIV